MLEQVTVSSATVESPLLSVANAMAYLGLSRTKFYELLREGAFPAVRFGDRRLLRRADLDAFIEANMEHCARKPVQPRKTKKSGEARRS